MPSPVEDNLVLLVSIIGYNQLEACRWKIPSPLAHAYAYSHYPFLPPTILLLFSSSLKFSPDNK